MEWISSKVQYPPQNTEPQEPEENIMALGFLWCECCERYSEKMSLKVVSFGTLKSDPCCDVMFRGYKTVDTDQNFRIAYWLPIPQVPKE